MSGASRTRSPWGALRVPAFRSLWIATVASNVGTWVHEVSAGWLMTSMAPEPVLVALVQAATSIPMFVLALPAGALADIVDRRRLLLMAQTWMMATAVALASLAYFEAITPPILLLVTAALGTGAAMTAPAWRAIVSELVPDQELTAALVLNGLGTNVARAVGPALGGLVVAGFGPGAAFLLNAVSFGGVVFVLYRWRRSPLPSHLPPERLFGAIRSGLRYVRRAPAFKAVIVRGGAFLLGASAVWALIPLFARLDLSSGPVGYGVLLATFGIGAIGAAVFVPGLRERWSADHLVSGAAIVFAASMVSLANSSHLAAAGIATFVGGGAWLILLSTLNVSAQTALPAWVRARALAVYLVVFFGAMSAGSVAWGFVAGKLGVPVALQLAACSILGGLLLLHRRFRVSSGEGIDLAPDIHWPAPEIVDGVDLDHGPVLVTLEYHVEQDRVAEFSSIMDHVRVIRERDGAILWGLFADVANPTRHLEWFLVDSWIEHLRQHERITVADRMILERARRLHASPKGPVVSHLVAMD